MAEPWVSTDDLLTADATVVNSHEPAAELGSEVLKRQVKSLQAELNAVYSSLSWRSLHPYVPLPGCLSTEILTATKRSLRQAQCLCGHDNNPDKPLQLETAHARPNAAHDESMIVFLHVHYEDVAREAVQYLLKSRREIGLVVTATSALSDDMTARLSKTLGANYPCGKPRPRRAAVPYGSALHS